MSVALPSDISVTVSRALAEDIGEGDLTAALVPESGQAQGRVISRQEAVICGAANNHRMGLYDGILIKENHIMAVGGIAAAVQAARAGGAQVPVEVEVETLEQVHEALQAGADILLLDNFGIPGMREAVRIAAGRAKLEASGGIDMEVVRQVAETGVDYISVGSLTKHVQAVDSMRFEFGRH
jgi:nicotinate-nucleotide pyrophosphorylase (carboxylating)